MSMAAAILEGGDILIREREGDDEFLFEA